MPATLAALALMLALAACPALAQDDVQAAPEKPAPAPKDLATQSLPLRTALHHDPTLAAPLARLLEMYRGAGAEQDLLGMYRAYVAQYPGNPSGQTVLVRLLMATGSPEALSRARAAAAQFPKDAYLRYLVHQVLQARRDPKALEELDQAVALETDLRRKTAWVDQLLPLALAEGRRDLAEKHLVALAALADAPEGRLEVARKMVKHRFFEQALALVEKPGAAAPSPETMVSLELEAATAEVGLDRGAAAAARLDKLLGRLTADYWRRGQIVARRLALVKTQAERDAMIAAARKRVEDRPRDEAAVLDLAEMLAGFQLRREALDVLLAAGRSLPKSAEIEKRTLDLFDRLRDEHGRQQYLAERIKAQPDRDDLVLMQVKTLYLRGRAGEARTALDGLVKKASPEDRASTLLAVARFLRRSALPADAADLLVKVVEADPARLDVRRELAETYLVLGRRQEVRALLSGGLPKQADLEKLMDLVQFMVQQEFFVEARDALAARVQQEQANLDIRMLLLTVYRRLGSQASGRRLIDESRKLADTIARYRLWLESAVAFYEAFGTADALLAEEQSRLEEDAGPWTDNRLERRLTFAQIAARAGRREEVAALLRKGLEEKLTPDARVRVRRELIGVLEANKLQPAARLQAGIAIQAQLEALAKDAPQYADECNARLALLHVAAQRQDIAMALVAKIDVDKIQDAALLSGLKNFHRQQTGDQKQLLAILRRLTVINPTDRSAWVEWVGGLAASGDETQLCTVLRRLLAGVDKMPLSDQTRALLEQHLADSHWRSIARLVAEGQPSALADALPLVDAVERIARDDQQWLWIAWTRAYLLGRLDRTKARDEAIKELERVALKLHDPVGSPGARIAFPDGLSVSLEHARKLLTAPAPPPPAGPASSQGPLGALAARWAFDTGAAAVAAIVPLDDTRTLVCDRAGTGYCLDAATGRLLWQRDGVAPPVIVAPSQNRYGSSGYGRYSSSDNPQPPTPPELLSDGKGRFYVPGSFQVTCRAADDGRLLWRADVGDAVALGRSKTVAGIVQRSFSPGATAPPVALFLHEGQLLTYEPLSGTVTRIDPATGKIVWDRAFPGHKQVALTAQNAGASLWGDRLLIYGSKTAIVDLATGQVEWSFEPYRVRKLPVELPDPALERSMAATAFPMTSSPYGTPYLQPSYSRYAVTPPAAYSSYGASSQPVQYVDYLQQQQGIAVPPGGMRLTSSAVAWAALAEQGNFRRAALAGPWLLLFGPNGLQAVRTDLPLASRPLGQPGAFLGMSGGHACVLSNGVVTTVLLGGDSSRQFNLAAWASGQAEMVDSRLISGGRIVASPARPAATTSAPVPAQVVLDGPLLYVTGRPGVLAINAATAQRAFESPWPEAVAPPKTPAPAAVADTSNTTGYVPGPVSTYSVNTYTGSTTVSPSGSYYPASGWSPYMSQQDQARQAAQVLSTIARVHRGVLYTLVSPSKVVALAQRGAHGR